MEDDPETLLPGQPCGGEQNACVECIDTSRSVSMHSTPPMGATLFRLTQDDNFSVDLSNQQLDDYNENSEYARQKILSEVKSRLDEEIISFPLRERERILDSVRKLPFREFHSMREFLDAIHNTNLRVQAEGPAFHAVRALCGLASYRPLENEIIHFCVKHPVLYAPGTLCSAVFCF